MIQDQIGFFQGKKKKKKGKTDFMKTFLAWFGYFV